MSPLIRLRIVLSLAVSATVTGATAAAEQRLTVGTWGGPYEAAQRTAFFTPFEAHSGIKIETQPYFGGLELLRSHSPPDIIDMLEEEALIACEQGLILELSEEALLKPFVDDTSRRSDFFDEAISSCAIAHLTFSTLVAFDEGAFSGEKPQRISDFFDVDRFPGKRGLRKDPAAIFEWAIMAEGVPVSQVYDLLSSERGMRIVLRRLDTIREHVVWWEKPVEAVALLEAGEAVMSSGYNGRFFEAWLRGVPINMIWDGQIVDRSVWVITQRNGRAPQAAIEFIRFATQAERMAELAEHIPYGPARKSAFKYIGLHANSGIVMADHLPTAEHHMKSALFRDTRWYARTDDFRRRYFQAWLQGDHSRQ